MASWLREMAKRAAVVIGIDKTGGMTPLNAAVICARRVVTWLRSEGYDVVCLTDETDAVTLRDVKTAIKRFVTIPVSYEQLVVYFTGHGQYHTFSDFWLLTDAPGDPDEAVNLEQAMHMARRCGIANVAFISDACRTLPGNAAASKVTGSAAFPNFNTIPGYSKVDYFKATGEATAAWEGKINGEDWSILTKAWMQAYLAPTPDMVKRLPRPGGTVEVVPNRRLESFMKTEVNRLLFKLKLFTTPQELEVNVASADDVYIATCRTPPPAPPGASVELGLVGGAVSDGLAAMSMGADASDAITRELSHRGFAGHIVRAPYTVHRVDTDLSVAARLPDENVRRFETACGFSVTGARIADVIVAHGGSDPPERRGEEEEVEALRIYPERPATSTLIEFDDGRGTVLPALHGFIGHITVASAGVVSVSYIPSETDGRFAAYAERALRLDRLRALASISSEAGAFRVASERDAEDLLGEISYGGSVDPALSLYAAHVFSEVGAIEALQALIRLAREDLGVFLFDHMLIGDFAEDAVASGCPMLTRSWNLLGLGPARVHPVYARARAHLCASLWTTFEPEGLEMVKSDFPAT